MRLDPEARLARLASRRHGVVTPEDARRCGVSERTFYRRSNSGQYVKVHHGTYRSVAVPWTPEGELLAAVTAAGADAVASGVSALAAWRLGDRRLQPPYHVASRDRVHRDPQQVIVHRTGWLTEADRTRLGPIPITTVPATIVTAAVHLERVECEEIVLEAQRRWRHIAVTVQEICGRAPGNTPGRGTVLRTLERFDPEVAAALMSRLESRGLVLVRRLGLPEPAVNRRLHAPDGSLIAKLDFDWEPPGVTIEWDGLRYHSTPSQKRYDDARQNEVVLSGRTVLRYGWADLRDEPDRIASDLRRAFAMRGAPL